MLVHRELTLNLYRLLKGSLVHEKLLKKMKHLQLVKRMKPFVHFERMKLFERLMSL
jgi:hypothetical protein